jgi:hypothetical protein
MIKTALSHMNVGSSLGDLVVRHRPGTEIEIMSKGTESVICFRSGSEELLLGLDDDLRWKSLDDVLGSVANMLHYCSHCTNSGLLSFLCRSEYRKMARRLREFLGVTGYQDFVSHAPISVGENETRASQSSAIVG